MPTLLRVEGISVRRGGRAILDGVSFTAHAGEILGVIGPNGAGKTTLFEAVANTAAEGELFYLPDGIRPWAGQRAVRRSRFPPDARGDGAASGEGGGRTDDGEEARRRTAGALLRETDDQWLRRREERRGGVDEQDRK